MFLYGGGPRRWPPTIGRFSRTKFISIERSLAGCTWCLLFSKLIWDLSVNFLYSIICRSLWKLIFHMEICQASIVAASMPFAAHPLMQWFLCPSRLFQGTHTRFWPNLFCLSVSFLHIVYTTNWHGLFCNKLLLPDPHFFLAFFLA